MSSKTSGLHFPTTGIEFVAQAPEIWDALYSHIANLLADYQSRTHRAEGQ